MERVAAFVKEVNNSFWQFLDNCIAYNALTLRQAQLIRAGAEMFNVHQAEVFRIDNGVIIVEITRILPKSGTVQTYSTVVKKQSRSAVFKLHE